jgi:hypothetical protein
MQRPGASASIPSLAVWLAVMAPTLMPASVPSPRMDRGDDHRGWCDEDTGGGRAAIWEGFRVNGATAQEHGDEDESDHASHGCTSCVRLCTLYP